MYPFITVLNKNISTYGVLMLIAVILVFVLAFLRARKRAVQIDDMLIIGAFSLLFAITFANLLYILVSYSVTEIVSAVLNGRFEMFGGLVYYGGLVGGVLGGILGTKVAKVNTQIVENAVIPYLPIGHAVGRIGCVMAGCCHGMEYEGIFSVHYPKSIAGLPADQGYFPVQILEAVLNVFIALFLIWYSKRDREPFKILSLYVLLYAVSRFLLEFLRGDKMRGIYFGVSLSQWIAIMLFIISIGYLVNLKFKKRSD